MIDQDRFEPDVALPKKAAKIDENSTPRRRRKTKKGTTDELSDKLMMKNTTKKPAGTGEMVEVLVVEAAQTSTRKARPVEHSGFDDQLGHKLSIGYMKTSMRFDR